MVTDVPNVTYISTEITFVPGCLYSSLFLQVDFIGERLAYSVHASPKSTLSDSILFDQKGNILRSMSSPTLQDVEFSVLAVDDALSLNKGFIDELEEQNLARQACSSSVGDFSRQGLDVLESNSVRVAVRSKSVDSPCLKRGQPNTIYNGLLKDPGSGVKNKGKLDKSLISGPSPIIVPVLDNALAIKPDSALRRSRRDDFERERMRHVKQKSSCERETHSLVLSCDIDKSVASQLDASLMEVVLPPPQGFGDQTVCEDKLSQAEDEDEEIDVGSDLESEAGFSTISGGTVIRRAESGLYYKPGVTSLSGSSIVSSVSCDSLMKPASSMVSQLQPSISVDSLLSVQSRMSSHNSTLSTLGLSISSDSGKGSMLGEISDQFSISSEHPSGSQIHEVVMRHQRSNNTKCIQSVLEDSRGLKMLCENYTSMSEDDSTESKTESLDITIGSHLDELENMPTQPDVSCKKSISAEDLQAAENKVSVPVRAHSMYVSPCKKYNFKPHLEITKQTHNILARAGFFKPSESKSNAKDVQVPVKSPKRSSYREEMMLSLRSSFHERHTKLNSSLRSLRSLPNRSFEHSASSKTEPLTQNRKDSDKDEVPSSGCAEPSVNKLSPPELDCTEIDVEKVIVDSDDITSEIQEKLEIRNDEVKNENIHSPVKDQKSPVKIDDEVKSEYIKTPVIDQKPPVKIDDEVESENIKTPVKDNKSPVTNYESVCFKDNLKAPCTEFQKPVVGRKKLKDIKESLTLSAILDKEIAQQVQIKRAEMMLPKHDSISNIQQAGFVSHNVKQFTKKLGKDSNFSLPPSKRGNSPVRIPTIFVKNQEAQRYREISQFSRERSGFKPRDFKTTDDQDAADFMGGEKEVSSSVRSKQSAVDCSSFETPLKKGQIELSDSLMETINDVCTPRAEKVLASSEEEFLVKSPLKESTNIVQSAVVSSLKTSNLAENVSLF